MAGGIVNFEDLFTVLLDIMAGEEQINGRDDYLLITKRKIPVSQMKAKMPRPDEHVVMVPWEGFGSRVNQSTRVDDFELHTFPFEAMASLNRDEQLSLEAIGFTFNKMREMGKAGQRFDNEVPFGLLLAATGADEHTYTKHDKKATWSTIGYDGSRLFSAHTSPSGLVTTGTNIDAGGADPWWFLVDENQGASVLYGVMRDNEMYEFEGNFRETGERRWGQDGRSGFAAGDWRAVYASNQVLDETTLRAAKAAAASFKNDDGTPAGVSHNRLLVGASNEIAARQALRVNLGDGGTNVMTQLLQIAPTRWLV